MPNNNVIEFNNTQCVVLAAYNAGAAQENVDTEDIAVHAHKLFPQRFSWQKYPEYPDLAAVAKRLFDARLDKNGHFLDGSQRNGWSLTPNGLKWVKCNEKLLKQFSLQVSSKQKLAGMDGKRRAIEGQRIKETLSYKLFLNGRKDEITLNEAERIFRIDEYVEPARKRAKIARAMEIFDGDEKMISFLEILEGVILK